MYNYLAGCPFRTGHVCHLTEAINAFDSGFSLWVLSEVPEGDSFDNYLDPADRGQVYLARATANLATGDLPQARFDAIESLVHTWSAPGTAVMAHICIAESDRVEAQKWQRALLKQFPDYDFLAEDVRTHYLHAFGEQMPN